jgi:hypothetical protein
MITNTPFKKLGDYTVDELNGVTVEQLAGVSFDRQFAPMTNTSKASSAETWATIITTWANETRTWRGAGSTIENITVKNLGSYTVDELASFSADQIGGVSFDRQFSPISNTSKPS